MSKSAENEPTEFEERLAAKAAAEAEAESAQEEVATEEEEFDIEGLDEEDIAEAIDLNTLVEDHEAACKERDDLKDQLLRARAEFDNFRRRTAREIQELRATAAADLVRELLPVNDNLARAVEHLTDPEDTFAKGVQMVADQFAASLAKAGVERIVSVGEPFDPTIHDALAQQPSDDVASGTIILEYEPGYRMGDTVVRPAKVVVSAGPEDGGENTNEDTAAIDSADQED